MTIVWIILAAIVIFFVGRLTVKQRGAIVLAGISLTAFEARVKANLAEGRRAFEAKHKSEIKALTLTPAELAAIKPQPRKR